MLAHASLSFQFLDEAFYVKIYVLNRFLSSLIELQSVWKSSFKLNLIIQYLKCLNVIVFLTLQHSVIIGCNFIQHHAYSLVSVLDTRDINALMIMANYTFMYTLFLINLAFLMLQNLLISPILNLFIFVLSSYHSKTSY